MLLIQLSPVFFVLLATHLAKLGKTGLCNMQFPVQHILTLSMHWSCLMFVTLADDASEKVLCSLSLKEKELNQLRDAIEDLYYFEFIIG